MTDNPAKRGDLAIIESCHSYYVIGQGTQVHDEFTVCEVTNIKRDGTVRAVRPVNLGESTIDLTRWTGYQRTYLVPKAGCRAIVTQDGDVDVVWDRTGSYGPDEVFHLLADHLDNAGAGAAWRARAAELLASRVMDTRVAGEHVLVDDGT